MNIQRMLAMLVARNREFYRDRAAFGWNFLFPFLIIVGFSLIFGNPERPQYKLGVFPCDTLAPQTADLQLPAAARNLRFVQLVGFRDLEAGLARLRRHQIDLLVENGRKPLRYWVNDASPKGYLTQRLLAGGLALADGKLPLEGVTVAGDRWRYLDWLFPGILAMNMMFSALWGVGFIVVRYRKNGVLKRLKATPLTALEYLTAMTLSRVMVLMVSMSLVWVGCDLIFHFRMAGSYLVLLAVFIAGSLSLTALGLLVAARGTSEEFSSGVINFITWPMMFLSEVWFSLEGSPEWIRTTAQVFPLTHLIAAARRVMQEGAGLVDVAPELALLLVSAGVFLALGAWLFSWTR